MANEQYFANGPTTTLAAAIPDYLATTLRVDNGANFPSVGDFTIKVDNEIMLVTGVSGTTWTVARGQENTQAIGHGVNAIVSMPLTQYGVEHLCSVFKNGTLVGTARRINLVDSATATWTVAPDPLNARIDITPTVIGGGGGGGGGSTYERTMSPVPKAADFDALYNNTGTTYVTDSNAGVNVYDFSHNSQSMRVLLSKTVLPAVPWCVTARLDGYSDQQGNEFGLLVWDDAAGSSTLKNYNALSYNVKNVSSVMVPNIRQIQATDATGAVTVGTELPPLPCGADVKWFRITQHDSKRFWQVSKDGYAWFSVAAGWDYFMSFCPTPTRAGVYVNANNNWGRDLTVTCGYFKVESWTGSN